MDVNQKETEALIRLVKEKLAKLHADRGFGINPTGALKEQIDLHEGLLTKLKKYPTGV